MKQRIRSILSHDLSGIGRVSLNAIIPIFSHYGIESISLPTSVFSSQTDGFDEYTYVDLTHFMRKALVQWKNIPLQADALYSGFLSSSDQISILEDLIKTCLRQDAYITIDPVLGDEGKLFPSIPKTLVPYMQHYIEHAHTITPNFTEICLLLNKDYTEYPSFSTIKNYLKELCIGKIQYVIGTSITIASDVKPCVVSYDKSKDHYIKIPYTQIGGHFPGAGDCFTSIFMAHTLANYSFIESLIQAIDFVTHAITITKNADIPSREGLLIEQSLSSFPKKTSAIRGRYEIYR